MLDEEYGISLQAQGYHLLTKHLDPWTLLVNSSTIFYNLTCNNTLSGTSCDLYVYIWN